MTITRVPVLHVRRAMGCARMCCQASLPVLTRPYCAVGHSSSRFAEVPPRYFKIQPDPAWVTQHTSDEKVPMLTARNDGIVWTGRQSKSLQDRLLLLDGKALVFRAYYRINTRVSHNSLKSMTRDDSADNSGWDSTMTTVLALNEILSLLELDPSHAAVIFDFQGPNFRHLLYPGYKANRSPTPDTVCQAINYTKAALLSMGLQVLEVPGVEADDVIGTLTLKAVAAGMKVRVASPDKDFFQLLCPQVRLLRSLPKGPGFMSFGVEEFGQKFPDMVPSQFVDMQALVGDKADNIPGVRGIGDKTARNLIHKWGTLEILLQNRDKLPISRARTCLLLEKGEALLSKQLLLLKSDIPDFAMQCSIQSLICHKPKDVKEYTKLVEAIVEIVGTPTSDNLMERTVEYWRRLESMT